MNHYFKVSGKGDSILRRCFFALLLITISASLVYPNYSFSQTLSPAEEAKLRAELDRIEKEQAETQKILEDTQKQSGSIQRDIVLLNARNKAAQLEIQKKNLLISSLGKDIQKKNQDISSLNTRIEKNKEALSQLMRKTNEIESYSMPEILLSNSSYADFASDVDNFGSVKVAMQDLFNSIKTNKTRVETEKLVLDKKKDQEANAKATIEQEKKTVEQTEAEKKRLLNITKNQEKEYQALLAEKRKRAAEIRAALFALRDTDAIPFGKAYEYALEASKKTGVRPAFLLAILTQESALGKNVGSCYLTDPTTGAGASVKSGNSFPNVMKPTRDVEPFIAITKELGLDPYKTLVSCPQSVGWGGAMGPAQFIASTWQLFKTRIATAVGAKVANPWEPKHAFIASAIYLSDLGADTQLYSDERNSACRYYSGSSCSPGSINFTYGEQVMQKAANIQNTMINPIIGL